MPPLKTAEVPAPSGSACDNLVVQIERFGLEHFGFVRHRLAELEPSQVRIRVRAASLNHRDLLIAQGRFREPTTLPLVPLSDCAGEVVEVGAKVEHIRVGDRVAASALPDWVSGPFRPPFEKNAIDGPADGVLSEFFTADAHGFVLVPDTLSFEQAATLPCAAVAAWNALFEQGNLKPGQTVLVLGSGGVSSFALQFAQAAGARVIATSGSHEKLRKLRELGAIHVINYTDEPEWSRVVMELTGGMGVDHVIETGGARTLNQSIRATAPGGCISLIGTLTGASGVFDTLPVLTKSLRLQGIVFGSVEMFERMIGTIDTLGIVPVIDRVFGVWDIAAALQYLESGRHVGKIVIRL
jgi:NADPH:quinone reductase-like Zn-dependent oxidoreductase